MSGVQDMEMSKMCSSVAWSFLSLSVSLQLQVGGTSSVKRSLNVPGMSITDCINVCCRRQNLTDGANSLSLCNYQCVTRIKETRYEFKVKWEDKLPHKQDSKNKV